jgi:hypothetical protein
MLQGLIQGARITDCEDRHLVFRPRPRDLFIFEHVNGELDIEGHLDTGSHDLSIPLQCMTVPKEEETAWSEDGELNRYASDKAFIVHIAAVLLRCSREYSLPIRWSHAKAA